MKAKGPIIFIDDDEDEPFILKPVLEAIAPKHPIRFFMDGQQVLNYLLTTSEQPFLIISDVNLRGMSGLELRQQIQHDDYLRKKSIPFVFFTAPVQRQTVNEAYELPIQGFFEKQTQLDLIQEQLQALVDYWSKCVHPNQVRD